MTPFRVLVVDDEPLARQVVVDLLRRDSEIAGVTETGDSRGVPLILATERPDIVFLDIEMPGLGGLDIASAAREDSPVIVFVTAFSQYALKAFDVQATDYLLKPFTDERFVLALDRAKRRVGDRRVEQGLNGAASLPDTAGREGRTKAASFTTRLPIGHAGDTQWIEMADVLWIEAEDYYVRLHTRQARHLVRVSMASLEGRLDPRMFIRSHRGAIVNVGAVVRVDADCSGLVLADGTHVAVSRGRRPSVARAVRGLVGNAG